MQIRRCPGKRPTQPSAGVRRMPTARGWARVTGTGRSLSVTTDFRISLVDAIERQVGADERILSLAAIFGRRGSFRSGWARTEAAMAQIVRAGMGSEIAESRARLRFAGFGRPSTHRPPEEKLR